MNYIVQDSKFKTIESYLENLSNRFQETYDEKGKYLFIGNIFYIMLTEAIVSFFLCYVMIIKLIPIAITMFLLIYELVLFSYLAIYREDVLKKAKIPIISKKRFLKKNRNNIKSILYAFNLTLEDVIVNSKTLEIKLNYSNPHLTEKLKSWIKKDKAGIKRNEK